MKGALSIPWGYISFTFIGLLSVGCFLIYAMEFSNIQITKDNEARQSEEYIYSINEEVYETSYPNKCNVENMTCTVEDITYKVDSIEKK